MADEERKKLSAIDETLKRLRAWWRDPSLMRTDFEARSVTAADNATRYENVALNTELEKLEAERTRIHSLLMSGQPTNAVEIDALAERADRLRQDFSSLMA